MRNKSISIKHHSGTFVRNTRKSVPALLDKELKFLHNLPVLVSLYDKQGDIDEVGQNCRDTYSGVDGITSVSTKKNYEAARRIRKEVLSRVKQGFTPERLANLTHSPVLVQTKSKVVNLRDLRDIQTLVCEERKRIRQFVFANSGGGRHYKKHIHKDELSKIRC